MRACKHSVALLRCSQGDVQAGTHLHLLVQVIAQDQVVGHAHPVGLWQWEAGGRQGGGVSIGL